ncbi:unnamed protein product, partial [Ectocarpus sp. 13 AM-2016]
MAGGEGLVKTHALRWTIDLAPLQCRDSPICRDFAGPGDASQGWTTSGDQTFHCYGYRKGVVLALRDATNRHHLALPVVLRPQDLFRTPFHRGGTDIPRSRIVRAAIHGRTSSFFSGYCYHTKIYLPQHSIVRCPDIQHRGCLFCHHTAVYRGPQCTKQGRRGRPD